MRLFIGVGLSDSVVKECEGVSRLLQKFGLAANFVPGENMHVTMHFLGEIADASEVKRKLSAVQLSPFSARLTCAGVFTPSFVRVVWVGAEGSGFIPLYEGVCIALGKSPEKDFIPHITLARVKFIQDKQRFLEMLSKTKVQPISFEVNSFMLMSSVLSPGGPKYSVVAEYNLKQA